jgi:hypothetical protein
MSCRPASSSASSLSWDWSPATNVRLREVSRERPGRVDSRRTRCPRRSCCPGGRSSRLRARCIGRTRAEAGACRRNRARSHRGWRRRRGGWLRGWSHGWAASGGSRDVQRGVSTRLRGSQVECPSMTRRAAVITVLIVIVAAAAGGYIAGGDTRTTASEASSARLLAARQAYDQTQASNFRLGRARGYARGLVTGRQAGRVAGARAGATDGAVAGAAARAAAIQADCASSNGPGRPCDTPGPGASGGSCPSGSVPNADGGVLCVPGSLTPAAAPPVAPAVPSCPPGSTPRPEGPHITLCGTPAP